jgi:hypothetical protein
MPPIRCHTCPSNASAASISCLQSDPSGNYSGWKATAIGANAASAAGVLKADYAEGCSLAEAEKLAVKVRGEWCGAGEGGRAGRQNAAGEGGTRCVAPAVSR